MIVENQSIGDDDVFPSSGGEDDHLCNVVGGERLDTLVYGVSLGLVAAKANDGEFLMGSSQ